jgi:hypothetical protein
MRQDDARATSRDDAARSQPSRADAERVVRRVLLSHDDRWTEYYRAVCAISGRRFVSRPVNLTLEQRKYFADSLRLLRRDQPLRFVRNPTVPRADADRVVIHRHIPPDDRWFEYYVTVCEVSGRRFVSRPVNLTPEQRKYFADRLRSLRREQPDRFVNPNARR